VPKNHNVKTYGGEDVKLHTFLTSALLQPLHSQIKVYYTHSVKHNRSSKVAVQGLVFVAHPLYIHTLTKSLGELQEPVWKT
jgi:hypothetical protein